VVNENETENTGVEIATTVITPAKTSDQSRENETHNQGKPWVVLLLDFDDGISFQISSIGITNTGSRAVDKHPSQVREKETSVGTIGVLVGIGPSRKK
jgi:hypothetical protein